MIHVRNCFNIYLIHVYPTYKTIDLFHYSYSVYLEYTSMIYSVLGYKPNGFFFYKKQS